MVMATKRKAAAEPEADSKSAPADASVTKRQRLTSKLVELANLECFMFGTNEFGALGLGDPADADDPDVRSRIPRPKYPVSSVFKFIQVSCGGMHTVGLTGDGDIYTWGVNDEGALGRKTSGTCWEKEPDSNKGDSFVPGQALLPGAVRAVQVAAGDGFTFAVGADGSLYGCGQFKDEVGALSGFTPDVKISGLFIEVWRPETRRDRIKKVECGSRHAVILTHRGEVYTWGCGTQGQLGRVKPYGQTTEYQPTGVELFHLNYVHHLESALGNATPANIACGAYSTFIVGENGNVAAWGLNNSCQLGIPKESEEDNLHWTPAAVESLQGVVQVAGGEHHTLALTKEGKLLSFGAATYGMLGRQDVDVTSANDNYPDPLPVDGLDNVKVVGLAAGSNVSACVTADGDVYLWGSNTNMQLAKGVNDADDALPMKMGRVKVFGYRKIYSVAFGGQHGALLAGPAGEVAPSQRAPVVPSLDPAGGDTSGAGPSARTLKAADGAP